MRAATWRDDDVAVVGRGGDLERVRRDPHAFGECTAGLGAIESSGPGSVAARRPATRLARRSLSRRNWSGLRAAQTLERVELAGVLAVGHPYHSVLGVQNDSLTLRAGDADRQERLAAG